MSLTVFSPSVARCLEWVDLSTITTSVEISGAEICVSPCSSSFWFKADEYCQVNSHILITIYYRDIQVTKSIQSLLDDGR